VYPFTDALTNRRVPYRARPRQPSGRVVAVALHEVGRVDPGTADRDDDVVGRDWGLALLEFSSHRG